MDFIVALLMLSPLLLILYVILKMTTEKKETEVKTDVLKVMVEENEPDVKEDEKLKKKAKKSLSKKTVRKVYHVVPADKGWLVKLAKNKTGTKFKTKTEAVAAAKKLGKEAKLGQVIVHKKDGKIQTEYTYGLDPKESKG